MPVQAARRELFRTAAARFAVTPPADGRPAVLEGHALVWNELSSDRGGYRVRLLPGSATFATPTFAFYNHADADFIGSTSNGTLTLTPDDIGVKVRITLPDTQKGRDTLVLVRDKYVEGMSFAMAEAPWAIADYSNGRPQIIPVPGASTVTEENGQLIVNVSGGYVVDEVTVTPFPSFATTSIGVALSHDTPAGSAAYATRIAHANRLESLKFESLRLAGPRLGRAATFPAPRA